MKKEKNSYKYLITNVLIILIKTIGGLISNCRTLLADGIFSMTKFVDEVYDDYSINKKLIKNKSIIGILIGLLVIAFGILMIKSLFSIVISIPSFITIIFLIVSFLLQLIFLKIRVIDIMSFILVLIVLLFSKFIWNIEFLKYADSYGSTVMSLLVVYMGLKIIKSSSNGLINNENKIGDANNAGITRSRNSKEKIK